MSNTPLNGQLMYDDVGQVLKVYFDGKWNKVKGMVDGIMQFEVEKKPAPTEIIDKSLFKLED